MTWLVFLAGAGMVLIDASACRSRSKSYDRITEPVAPGDDQMTTAPSGGSVVQLTPHAKPGTEAWTQRAVYGVAQPVPVLNFLDDQGNWHTPFDQPGMTGPYDLRGWHRRASR